MLALNTRVHPKQTTMKQEKQQIDSNALPSKAVTSQGKEALPEVRAEEKDAEEENALGSWEDFQEIAKGDFNRLLGCGG